MSISANSNSSASLNPSTLSTYENNERSIYSIRNYLSRLNNKCVIAAVGVYKAK